MLSKTVNSKIAKIAKEFNMTPLAASTIYIFYWKYIKETIDALPEFSSLSEEEFNKLKVNFNIPELGKFTTNYTKIQLTKRFIEYKNGTRVKSKKD